MGRRRGRRSTLSPIVFLIMLATAAGVYFSSQSWKPVPGTTGGSGTWYEVYFTNPQYPDVEGNRRGGPDEKLVEFLGTASQMIDIAIYDLDLSNVADALLAARNRGVKVRLVTDTDNVKTDAIRKLKAAGMPVVADDREPIMHDKFAVIDKQAVWTGSWNFTVFDTYRYNNNAVRINSPQLAENYTATFEKMFAQKKFGPDKSKGVPHPRLTIDGVAVENYFSPEDAPARHIISRIEQARTSIRFMAFAFTHDGIAKAVMDHARAGVKVQGVFETTGSETRFSEYGAMKEAGLDVLQDGNPYLMHHKVFIIDDRTVIFGSFNFSSNADEENDENLLIVDDPVMAQLFNAEFDKVYSQAKNPVKKQ